MKPRARGTIGLILPIFGVVAFALLLAFSLMRLSEIERDMRIEATQNMLWVISQAQAASLQLSDTVSQYALGAVERPELELRYNVFLSRIALLDAGPQRRKMEELGFRSELDALDRTAESLAPVLDRLVPDDRDAAIAAHAILAPHNSILGRAANAAMVAEWNELGNRLDTYRSQLWHIIASLAGISLTGGFLSIRLMLALRESKQRSRLLNSEKAFSELLIGSSGEGILAIDLEQRCTVWNEAMKRLFAMPPDRAFGSRLEDLSGFFKMGDVRAALERASDGQSANLLDKIFFPADGDVPLFLDLRCFPLRSGSAVLGVIVFISDVTERHAAQRELARHRDHLEELVDARTRELDEALDRERATADLYRNFAAMVSHQFRTPLSIIDSALQRMTRRRNAITPTELEARASKARQAIRRLTGLVESTLDAARLEAGQIQVRSEPCDIVGLARSVCERQMEASPDRQIILVNDHMPVTAHCDMAHAEHILANLVSNAVKYSPGRTQIVVTIEISDETVRCLVRSQGKTIAPADSPRLFERYFRGSNASGVQGTGIGLHMARTLARMQGGDVDLVETSDDQTTFRFSLPLVPSAYAVLRDKSPAKPAEAKA